MIKQKPLFTKEEFKRVEKIIDMVVHDKRGWNAYSYGEIREELKKQIKRLKIKWDK